ncbi:MAG: hypothetical protein ACTS4X_01940, partial [Candidatus Hodgkinia cicadicola]
FQETWSSTQFLFWWIHLTDQDFSEKGGKSLVGTVPRLIETVSDPRSLLFLLKQGEVVFKHYKHVK